MLEPYDGKLSRTVLRREGGGNTADPADYAPLVERLHDISIKQVYNRIKSTNNSFLVLILDRNHICSVFLRGDIMRKENVRCPMCGTMNYDVDLDATDGWTKCRLCKAVTCSMDEWKKHTVSVPLLNEKQFVARSMTRK